MTKEQFAKLSMEEKSLYTFIEDHVYETGKELTKDEVVEILYLKLKYRFTPQHILNE